MAIAKMKLMEIEFPKEKSEDVLARLVDSKTFHPEPASKFADSVKGLTVLNRGNPYDELLSRMDEDKNKHKLKYDSNVETKIINIEEANHCYSKFINEINQIDDVNKELQLMVKENKETIIILENMNDESINFDQLFGCHYLQVRFGRIPSAHLEQLDYYENQSFMVKTFYKDRRYCYVLYVVTEADAPEVDNIFSSLYFERIHIPEFVHGTPQDAIEQLKSQNQLAENKMVEYSAKRQILINDNIHQLSTIYATCQKNAVTAKAQQYVVVFGKLAAIFGFAEKHDAIDIQQQFSDMEDVTVEIKGAMGDSRLTPPTKLKNNWFAQPFKMFVEMYGVPSYTDFDPTNFVALSYTLLFGIMFGDVGQGIVLMIVGYLASKFKGMKLGEVGLRIGLSSTLFGFIFGSVFGNEEILTPFFMPMESSNTMTLLGAAIGIGVLLIIISMLFNTYLNFKKKHWGDFWFSQNGVAGLLFYISMILYVVNMLLGLSLPLGTPFILIGILIPVLLMFLKEPLTRRLQGYKMFPEGFGSFFTEGFFELFDVILTYITNTMSFLRVGGFVLSHAGMMLVVYTLASMVGGFGYWVVLLLGNIFVMVLEGMIVGIQVLRLEFYEMFSRYYEGNGKHFKSMKENL